MDLADPTTPKPLVHRNWCPPYAGGTHSPLPLPERELLVLADEATSKRCAKGLAYTRIMDLRVPSNP